MTWWRRLVGGDRNPTASNGGEPDRTGQAPADASGGSSAAPTLAATSDPGGIPPLHVLGVTPSGVEVRGFHAPAGELVGWWHRLRAEHATTGLWPVLLGEEVGDLAAALTPQSRHDYDDAAELRRATAMSRADLEALRAQRIAQYADEEIEVEPPGDELPPVVRRNAPSFTVAERDGIVALVPAAHGWQVPVILGWEGGVNYGVEPVDHGIVLRDWSQRYGVELVALSGDQVLEVLVHRPPATPAEALDVAREQYAYCSDVVEQGAASLMELARDQAGSESWFFWWD